MQENILKICMGSSCFARGNKENLETIKQFLKENRIEAEVILTGNLCEGTCNTGPNLFFNDVLYQNIEPNKINTLLKDILKGSSVV